MTSHVLILGGFGTIGARLAERLAATSRHRLTLSSRVPRDAPAWAPAAQTCALDITDTGDWSHRLDGVDTVVHLVSLTDFQAKDDPDEAWRVGVDGTRHLIDNAQRSGVTRIIFMSTGHVYGTPYTGHITESTPPNPQQPYATTHLEAEKLLANVHQTNGMTTVRLRLSNGFGYPKLRDNAIWQIVINDLCRQAIVNGSLTLKSSGLQHRNFIPFTDVCSALVHTIDMPTDVVGDGLFNLGSPEAMRVIDVAKRVQVRAKAVLGLDLELHIPPALNEGASPGLHYDSSKLRSTGLDLSDDLDAEIDALLRYCTTTFGGAS